MRTLFASILIFGSIAQGESITSEVEDKVSFSVTDHLLVSNTQDVVNNTPSTGVLHQDQIQAEFRNYDASLVFTNKYVAEGSGETQPIIFEKGTVTANYDNFKFEMGDSYQELGRGIALSLYKDDVFGLNTTMLGVSGKYQGEALTGKLFAGKVHTLQNPVAINPTPDPLNGNKNIYLTGAEATFHLTKETKFGGHYLLALERLDQPKIRPFSQTWHTFGITMSQENLFEDVDLYVEGNGLFNYTEFLDGMIEKPKGFGTYASLVWTPSPFEVKWEVKNYRDYAWDFRRAPTLEHDVVETEHPENVWGSRWMVTHRNIRARSKYFGSILLGADRVVNRDIYHGVVGAQIKGPFSSQLSMDLGYRDQPGYSNLAHASVQAKIKTGKGQTLELSLRKQYENEQLDLLPTKQDRNQFNLTYTFSPKFNASFGYEFVPSNDVSPHFAGLGLTYKAGALVANAFLGETSGGTVCSGGVCRVVPPFSGARVETVYAF